MSISTRQLYNESNSNWVRNEPVLLSDYTARPFLLEWCEPIESANILDLGCGEGYFARKLKRKGAGSVYGVDISDEMINRAAEQERQEPLGIDYRVGTSTSLSDFEDGAFDMVVAVFLFNYLTIEESAQTLSEINRVLKTGGRLVFAVPHPGLPFMRQEEPPFFFSRGTAGYFSGRNQQFEGKIWRRDGHAVAVRCVHKTMEDYFECLRVSGFTRLPEIRELGVTQAMIDIDHSFFSPLADQPLHLAFRLVK